MTDNKSDKEIENMFWGNIAFSAPLYGADNQGTFFDEGVKWDLKELPSILNYGLQAKLHGINTTFCYIGSWKTMFAWHKEDYDLSGINYNHYGKPKFWYGIQKDS